jgi:alcohol dehydrogenase
VVDELRTAAVRRTLLVTSRGSTVRGLTDRVAERIAGSVLVHDQVEPNPTMEQLEQSVDRLRDERFDTVVAVGGGSAIDTGKIFALSLAPDSPPLPALFERGDDDPPAIPLIAVPTTAGTGSEVTPFATVWSSNKPYKASLTHAALFPSAALVDPDLTTDLPWEQTLATGLDAYVQCFEALWNRSDNAASVALAERGLGLVPAALRTLHISPNAPEARSAMSEAALLSGLAIAQTRTALAHAMSYPITARLGMPHGLACALVLPAVLEYNVQSDDGRLDGFARRAGFGEAGALQAGVLNLYEDLGVPDAVRRYVDDVDALADLAPDMLAPGRADNNLRPVDEEVVRRIIHRTADLIGAEVST